MTLLEDLVKNTLQQEYRFYSINPNTQPAIPKEFNVLFEADNKNGMMHGFTENYIKVKTPFDPSLINQIVQVRIKYIDVDGSAEIEMINELLYC